MSEARTAIEARRAPLTLSELLAQRSHETPGQVAYTHLDEGESPGERTTYRELYDAVRVRAAALRHHPALGGYLNARSDAGRRPSPNRGSAVLMYPTSVEFVRGWLACAALGVAGAPVQLPTHEQGVRRLRSIADDAGTTLVLTTRAARDRVLAEYGATPELAGLDLVATDELSAEGLLDPDADPTAGLPAPAPSDVALLQYTSGSTGTPKGVMVTHANFWFNAAEIDALWPVGDDGAMVSWLPLFHDMGLMLGVVLPLWGGCPSYLMAPEAFIRRPARWLEALSRFSGTHSAAPNFAYELCMRSGGPREPIDLSRWRVAINGAEPVRSHTLQDFAGKFAPYGLRDGALAPAYGLAEHTLKVVGSPQGDAPKTLWLDAAALRNGRVVPLPPPPESDRAGAAAPVVSCGPAVGDTEVRIVHPGTFREADRDEMGEIWVSGPCVATGYIGRAEESESTFRARLAGAEEDGPFLRTGDMGFVRDGEVYVAGRLKDLIVVKGRNHYPQDIEYTAESSHPLLRPASAAAFPVDDGTREQLIVVVEADSRVLRLASVGEVVEAVREAIRSHHHLTPGEVVLIRRGTLPKTTSGKVSRRSCRDQYEAGTLTVLRPRAKPDVAQTADARGSSLAGH